MSPIEIFDYVCQAIICITGITAISLVSSQDPRTRMIAGAVGCLGEPFWLATAILNEQYGIVILVIIYFRGYLMTYINNRKAILEQSKS